MFGCVVAGRPLQTVLVQLDDTHAYFELASAATINHISTFLLGTIPFPDGYGCTVHFFWPGKGFQLLGMLSNEKPSAIFRLKGTFSSATTQNGFAANGLPSDGVTAILGFSIEPLDAIQTQIAGLSAGAVTKAAQSVDPTLLAERIVKHLFSYVSGFLPGGRVGPESAVPMSLFAKWYETFMSKVKAGGTGFLEREDN